MSVDPVILITGATGLIGGAWAPRLSCRARVVALVRGGARSVPGADAVLCCDLGDPRLGLDDATYRDLSDSVTEVVHCAADLRFTMDLAEARRSNVQPLSNLLALARRCHRLHKFAHLSTVFVVGDRPGSFDETPIEPGRFLSSYEQSKWEAECIALNTADVPVSIYRLSIVEGGMVRQIVRLARRHPFAAIPADPEARIDIIPASWAVAALDHLHRECFEPGRIRHVCAGPDRSPTVHDLIRVVQPSPVPALVSLEEFERLRAGWNGAANEMWGVLRRFLPHLAIRQEFRSDRTWAELKRAGIEMDAVFPTIRQL